MAATLKSEELLALVDKLADGGWHSGEELAALAHITRAALAKRIDKLEAWGLGIEARQGLGYRLLQPLERLDARIIRKGLSASAHQRLRGNLRVVTVTDSTNLRTLESDSADDPQVLLAEFQSAGRGRRGRSWVSPFGANLYLSMGWSFPHWPPHLTALPLAIGVACARALELPRLKLKWPNDLLADGRKLGGILIEQRGEAGGACRAIIGIGLNVAMREQQAAGIEQPWISLSEALGSTPSRNVLAAGLITQLMLALEQFSASGFAAFRAEWDRLDVTRSQNVHIEQGGEIQNGIARGVDDSGALVLETALGRQMIFSGEVSLRLK